MTLVRPRDGLIASPLAYRILCNMMADFKCIKTNAARKTLNIILLLLVLEQASIYKFILHLAAWKFRELKATMAGISNPQCSFLKWISITVIGSLK